MSEGSIIVAAKKLGIDDKSYYTKYSRLVHIEIPFTSQRKISVTFHILESAGYFNNLYLGCNEYTHIAIVKGAPEKVIFNDNIIIQPINIIYDKIKYILKNNSYYFFIMINIIFINFYPIN